MNAKRDIILFVGSLPKRSLVGIREYAKKHKEAYRIAVLKDSRAKTPAHYEEADIVLSCDMNSLTAIEKKLAPFRLQFLAATCDGDDNVPLLQKVSPFVPYVHTPTAASLEWSIDKIWMRRRFDLLDPSISPKHTVVENTTKRSLSQVEKEVGYPVVIKPTNLGASLLVNVCYDQDDLKQALRKVKRVATSLQKKSKREVHPRILAEEFMEGDMYSVDAYISPRGKIFFCPMVHVTTGRAIGFDDFFGYQRITPTKLNKKSIAEAERVASTAIRALGLRSSSAHVELIKTEDGWKIIELGPRIGGFRHAMYEKSYGINHVMNDVLVRIPKQPVLPKKTLGHTAVLYFYGKKEGVIKSINGIRAAKNLASFYQMKTVKKIGDRNVFAKHGGKTVLIFTLFNTSRPKLLADIRKLEQLIKIEVK